MCSRLRLWDRQNTELFNAYLIIHLFRNCISSHLSDMLLHTQPILVAHSDTAITPLVIVGTFLRITKDLLGLLKTKNKKTKTKSTSITK